MTNGNNIIFELGKISVDGYYDYQQIRIGQTNRIRDVIRRKIEGIPLDKPEKKKEKKDYNSKFDDKKLKAFLTELKQDVKLSENEKRYIEKLMEISKDTKETEERYRLLMDEYLQNEILWANWLSKIKGISSVLGSNLIKNFGYCETYQHVSSLWRHCGLDPDGAKGRQRGELIGYNPKLKTLAWKIGDSFIKQRTPVYRKIYDCEKERQMHMLNTILDVLTKKEKANFKKMKKRQEKRDFISNYNPKAPVSLLNADFRARRKMIKIFLQHYWIIGRQFKKLEITKPYPIDKMGHTHYIEPPFNPFENDVNIITNAEFKIGDKTE